LSRGVVDDSRRDQGMVEVFSRLKDSLRIDRAASGMTPSEERLNAIDLAVRRTI
jgi:hypothetical protein